MYKSGMFVVYVDYGTKKERLYFKAPNMKRLCDYLWYKTGLPVVRIKRLKRIYRKTDNFEEIY